MIIEICFISEIKLFVKKETSFKKKKIDTFCVLNEGKLCIIIMIAGTILFHFNYVLGKLKNDL